MGCDVWELLGWWGGFGLTELGWFVELSLLGFGFWLVLVTLFPWEVACFRDVSFFLIGGV